MTRTRMLGAAALGLLLAGPAAAQTPYNARVTQDGAEVRSGPSSLPEMYATNRLAKDAVVEVLRELPGGWLEIRPPSGSFSWINHRFVERVGQTSSWAVHADGEAGAPVLIGSSLGPQKRSVRGPSLGPPAQVVVVGSPVVDAENNTTWLPIHPPPKEVRYVRAEAVEKIAASVQAFIPPPVAAPVVPVGATAPSTAPTALLPPADPVLVQAQQAEQAGRIDEAVRLYTDLGKKYVNTDPHKAHEYYNRAARLRERRGPAPAAPVSRLSEPPLANPSDGRLKPVPTGATVASYVTPQPCTLQPPQGQKGPASGSVPAAPVRWHGPARLRLAACWVDRKPTYVLETSPGPLTYVTAQGGGNLDGYVGQTVEVYGPIVYRMDVRAYYVTAAQVKPSR